MAYKGIGRFQKSVEHLIANRTDKEATKDVRKQAAKLLDRGEVDVVRSAVTQMRRGAMYGHMYPVVEKLAQDIFAAEHKGEPSFDAAQRAAKTLKGAIRDAREHCPNSELAGFDRKSVQVVEMDDGHMGVEVESIRVGDGDWEADARRSADASIARVVSPVPYEIEFNDRDD